jgi:small neutral amino acid transporter SnatA (MarC family)
MRSVFDVKPATFGSRSSRGLCKSRAHTSMSPLLIKIRKDFATLWTTIDPIGNVALFAGLTASLTRAERHLTALRAVIYATIILVAAGTVGQVILDAIGIHMHSLKVAGGIILFLFGVQMLFGKMDAKTERSPEEGGAISRCSRWRCLPSPDRAQ